MNLVPGGRLRGDACGDAEAPPDIADVVAAKESWSEAAERGTCPFCDDDGAEEDSCCWCCCWALATPWFAPAALVLRSAGDAEALRVVGCRGSGPAPLTFSRMLHLGGKAGRGEALRNDRENRQHVTQVVEVTVRLGERPWVASRRWRNASPQSPFGTNC